MPKSTRNISNCQRCPASKVIAYPGGVDEIEYITYEWRCGLETTWTARIVPDEFPPDQKPPAWCPLRKGAITLQVAPEE